MSFTDLPVGFGMTLAENQVALNAYNALTQEQRDAVIQQAREAQTVEEMHMIVSNLSQGKNL